LTAFSQTVTQDSSKITLPYSVAKQIALDLVSGDSAKEELAVTKTVLEFTEKKVIYQDSLISGLSNKNQLYAQQIVLYKDKEQQYIKYTKDLKKDVRKAKIKNKLATVFGTIALLGGILYAWTSIK
jgi:hypothetical protein